MARYLKQAEPLSRQSNADLVNRVRSILFDIETNRDVAVRRYAAEHLSPGDLILSQAFRDAADCIVMGAHGHTRQNEKRLGGVTGTVMKATTIPVFLSR